MLDIPTPKPLAYLERYKGPILWESYLVTQYVDGQKLYNFLSDSHVDVLQRNQVTGQVISLIEELDRHMISHGDLKHTNILLTDQGPAIMDLDGMKVHRCRWLYQKKRVKELTHFATGGRGAYGVIPVERLLRE
jgi:serine/threonine protein kinase